MKTSVSDIKKGNVILIDDVLHQIIDYYKTQPGKGGAYAQIKLKNLNSGAIFEKRFRSAETVERAHLESKKVQYLYNDGEGFNFMDNETYEQFSLDADIVGDSKNYLKENSDVVIKFHGTTPLEIEFPTSIALEVTFAEPAVRGNTASGNPQKEVELETGLKVMVPMFITEGEMVKVDTRTGEYLERAKK
jgi:elongation factor P